MAKLILSGRDSQMPHHAKPIAPAAQQRYTGAWPPVPELLIAKSAVQTTAPMFHSTSPRRNRVAAARGKSSATAQPIHGIEPPGILLHRSTAREKAAGSKAMPPIHMSAFRSGESVGERRALK
jgi:hypothetical protein